MLRGCFDEDDDDNDAADEVASTGTATAAAADSDPNEGRAAISHMYSGRNTPWEQVFATYPSPLFGPPATLRSTSSSSSRSNTAQPGAHAPLVRPLSSGCRASTLRLTEGLTDWLAPLARRRAVSVSVSVTGPLLPRQEERAKKRGLGGATSSRQLKWERGGGVSLK